MDKFFILYGMALAVLIAMAMVRLIKGPGLYNRIGAVSTIGTKSIVLVLLMGMAYGRLDMVIDIGLTYAMLNFLGTVAATKYLGGQEGENYNGN